MNQSQALQVQKLPNNGFFLEEISSSLIVSHHHSTYIPFNITSIKLTLNNLLSNILALEPTINNKNNSYCKTHFLHAYKALNRTFDTFAKLDTYKTNTRRKRGLMNLLGSGIKFITGNLDNADLETITQNFEILKHNQLNAMHKVNDLSSFAGNIMSKFTENVKIINDNSEKISYEILNLNNSVFILVKLQDLYIQISNLNQFLDKLLRIFSFAHLKTLDLEIFSLEDINNIWQYLELHYPKNTLWSITHISELTLICKTGLLIFEEMAILVIKIPIFDKNICNLRYVYPIPNNSSKILISPSKYYCNDLWYENCEVINSR